MRPYSAAERCINNKYDTGRIRKVEKKVLNIFLVKVCLLADRFEVTAVLCGFFR